MNKRRVLLDAIMVLAILSGGVADMSAGRSQDGPRHYNCRMPRRDKENCKHNIGRDCKTSNPLFADMPILPQQLKKAEKEYRKYKETVDRLALKNSYSYSKKSDKIHRELVKNEETFLRNIRKIFTPEQYRMFEMRFYNLFPNRPDAFRPGKGSESTSNFGPIERGPQPTLMTRPGK